MSDKTRKYDHGQPLIGNSDTFTLKGERGWFWECRSCGGGNSVRSALGLSTWITAKHCAEIHQKVSHGGGAAR